MSDTRDPETDQPLPVINANDYVQDMVITDLRVRLQHGIRKYGTGLQAGNGRDMLQDAYEEVLDLAVYLRGEIEERNGTVPVPRTALIALVEEYRACAVRADEGYLPGWTTAAEEHIAALSVASGTVEA